MTVEDKPNIFEYATSELSQDAFLCWLFSWFKPEMKRKDLVLHKLAMNLLKKFFALHGKKFPKKINRFEVITQYKHIDIFLIINNEIAIILEDKIRSKQHSKQLSRYLSSIEKVNKYSMILPIYFQMGQQSNYKAVEEAGYAKFLRKDFLEILNNLRKVDNNILEDYISYLNEIENNIQSYKHLALDYWKSSAWQGFYIEVRELLDEGEWDYVSNPSGGFYGFWWHWRDSGNRDQKEWQYLQLEQDKLCFKIQVDDIIKRTELKWKWHDRVMKVEKESTLDVIKPSRLRNGHWMTVAILADDYRRVSKNGMIDMKKTMAVIHEAELILDRAVGES